MSSQDVWKKWLVSVSIFLFKILCAYLKLFHISAKVLVATGTFRIPLEIIDLINTASKNDLFWDETVIRRDDAFGGLLQNKPLICGGYDLGSDIHPLQELQDCIILGQSNEKINMLESRRNAACVALDQKTLWVTGGIASKNVGLYSTEFISFEKSSVKGPDLPMAISGHAMVHVDPKNIYIIGGYTPGKWSNETWIVDSTNGFDMKKGPCLETKTCRTTCSKMKISGKTFLVALANDSFLDSVEVLDTTSPDQGWIKGMKFKFCINY